MIMIQTADNLIAREEDSEILAKNVLPTTMYNNNNNNNISNNISMQSLLQDFQPGPMDVICARGNRALNHSGNKRFRALIQSRLEEYNKATSKLDKSLLVSSIVESVRQASPDGGFVKERDGQWFEVGDHMAREKIGQTFRDILHFKYTSSTKAKKCRRKKLQGEIANEVEQFTQDNAKVVTKFEQVKAFCNVSINDHDTMESHFDEANMELLKQIKHRTWYEAVGSILSLPVEPSTAIRMPLRATSISSPYMSSSVHQHRFDFEPVSRAIFVTGGESWESSVTSTDTSNNDDEDASGPI
jgi:hypothetical protein